MGKRIIIIIAVLAILALMGTLLFKTMNLRTFQFFGGLVSSVETEEKVVALTFDDGPTKMTEEILRVLERADIKATFFLNGSGIAENPEAAREIAEAGHQLGNHTYSHNRMVFKAYSYIKREIDDTDKLIRETGYSGDIHFRPPNGKKLLLLPYYLSRHDRKTIMWNMEPDSYPELASSPEKITEYVERNIKPGSIILLHVMYDNAQRGSLEAVGSIAASLKDKGYRFVTVSQLLEYGKKK